jgi:predicted nucleic acid-binding Zn ribbon protein
MRKRSAHELIRSRVLREWRGMDEPLNLNANVHRAGDVIGEIMRVAGLTEGMEEGRLREIWSSVMGDFVAKCSEPVSLKRGCLTIRVTQPAMRFHLEQMRGSLLDQIQKAAANNKIQSLRFAVG